MEVFIEAKHWIHLTFPMPSLQFTYTYQDPMKDVEISPKPTNILLDYYTAIQREREREKVILVSAAATIERNATTQLEAACLRRCRWGNTKRLRYKVGHVQPFWLKLLGTDNTLWHVSLCRSLGLRYIYCQECIYDIQSVGLAVSTVPTFKTHTLKVVRHRRKTK